MNRSDLTRTAIRRFDKNCVCPICNQKIQDDENMLVVIKRKRRFKVYTFYHKRCLINGKKEK